MLIDDLQLLVDRLERIDRAVDLACMSLERRASREIADALTDTCDEALRIGHELTLRVWYHDPWSELDTLHQIWVTIESLVRRIAGVDVDTRDGLSIATLVREGMAAICIQTAALDAAQLQVMATPRDAMAISGAASAISGLESAADTLFMDALTAESSVHTWLGPGVSRLDAAYAVLTSAAARSARERATVESSQF